MEYFRKINVKTNGKHIQEQLTLDNLENISTQFFALNNAVGNEVNIGGMWGEFTLRRSIIEGGLRFDLMECPNALAWTITTGFPPDTEAIIIHLTINRQKKDQEFIDEILEFLDDHCEILHTVFNKVD